MSEASEAFSITKDTRVQLAVVVALFAGIFGAMRWAQSMKTDQIAQGHAYEMSQQEMRGQLREMKTSIDTLATIFDNTLTVATESHWEKTQQDDWASRLQLLNPGIVVPDPRNDNRPYDLSRLPITTPH